MKRNPTSTLPHRGSLGFLYSLSILFLFCVVTAPAQDVTCTFVSPSGPLIAGRNSLWLYCMNNSSNEIQRAFESNLNSEIISSSGTSNTVLQLNPQTSRTAATIPPAGFARAEYLFDVPSNIHGQVTLVVSNYNQVLLRVEGPSETLPAAAMTPPPEQTNVPSRFALLKFLNNRFSPYEPIYFLLGTYPAAEFQLSLKYQLFDFTNSFSPLTNLYFAYTQTSFWDLISSDPSFFDTSYKPSIFVYHPEVFGTSDKSFQLDLQGGAEHESNGRGGTEERSLYTAYLQPTLTFGRPGHLQLTLQPRAWTYFWVGHNNPNIAEFRGYADLVSALTLKNDPDSWANFQLSSRFRIGDEGTHAGIQIDLRYKIPHFNPAIDLQYFAGYGQTLRQYNVESHSFRAGLCIWYWPDYPLSHTTK